MKNANLEDEFSTLAHALVAWLGSIPHIWTSWYLYDLRPNLADKSSSCVLLCVKTLSTEASSDIRDIFVLTNNSADDNALEPPLLNHSSLGSYYIEKRDEIASILSSNLNEKTMLLKKGFLIENSKKNMDLEEIKAWTKLLEDKN